MRTPFFYEMVFSDVLTNLLQELEWDLKRNKSSLKDEILLVLFCKTWLYAYELRYGYAKKGSAKLTEKVENLLATITVVPLENPVDAEYGRIRAELEAAGQTIGMNDLLIAAQAYTLGLTLVTDNLREFSRIHGLKIENWLER